jgi:hypothetical protein
MRHPWWALAGGCKLIWWVGGAHAVDHTAYDIGDRGCRRNIRKIKKVMVAKVLVEWVLVEMIKNYVVMWVLLLI